MSLNFLMLLEFIFKILIELQPKYLELNYMFLLFIVYQHCIGSTWYGIGFNYIIELYLSEECLSFI